MKAAFTMAVWYEVSAECRTPLRTGGADNDPETVLRDADGGLLLQGSSIAGALREWLEKDGGDAADRLFGSSAADGRIHPGRLRISDGVFCPEAEISYRPRLKLEPSSRTAEDGQKYDMASIQTGARFDFHMIWLGCEAQEKSDLDAVERMLSALRNGEICLGGQKSNGFGRVELQYRKRAYHLAKPKDREDWLNRKPPESEWITPKRLTGGRQARFTLRFHADSLLVKAGAVEIAEESDKGESENTVTVTVPTMEGERPVIPGSSVAAEIAEESGKGGSETTVTKCPRPVPASKEESGKGESENTVTVTVPIMEGERPVIPGSSVKGAVRARIEKIVALKKLPNEMIESLFGRKGEGGDDTGAAGAARFYDIPLPAGERPRIRRIRINRFTGGVIKTGLFTEEPTSTRRDGAPPAELRVSLPIERKADCALLLYALRDLAWNLYGLGSGRSVGRGNLDALELEIRYPDGGKTVFRFLDGFQVKPEGDLETVRDWLTELEAKSL